MFWEPARRGSVYSACKLSLNLPVLNTEPPLPSAALVQYCLQETSHLLRVEEGAGRLHGLREGSVALTHTLNQYSCSSPAPRPHVGNTLWSPFFSLWWVVCTSQLASLTARTFNILSFAFLSPTCFPSFKSFAHIPPPLSSFSVFLRIYTFLFLYSHFSGLLKQSRDKHMHSVMFLWKFMIIFTKK